MTCCTRPTSKSVKQNQNVTNVNWHFSFPKVGFAPATRPFALQCPFIFLLGDEWSLRAFASMPSTAIVLRARAEIKNLLCELASNAKFGEHEQASTRLNFASKSSKGKILRAVKNFNFFFFIFFIFFFYFIFFYLLYLTQ